MTWKAVSEGLGKRQLTTVDRVGSPSHDKPYDKSILRLGTLSESQKAKYGTSMYRKYHYLLFSNY